MGTNPLHTFFFAEKASRDGRGADPQEGGVRSRLGIAAWKTGREIRRICRHAKKALSPARSKGAEKNGPGGKSMEEARAELFQRRGPGFVPPAHIKDMISDPGIAIVSFDVFDTLLVRPALQPRDIFYLLAKKVDAAYGVDFIRLRWNAEAELGRLNAGIREIYDFMARKHHLDARTAEALMAEEIRCEATLLAPRPDVRELYEQAVKLGKRVIAVSDMYLPGEVIADILRRKGFPMDAVYVSCDHGARKSDGALYDIVLAAEGGHPSEMLHVGDNWQSDYMEALGKRITAVWLPSIQEMCFHEDGARELLFGEALRRDPLWSIFLGFSLNRLYGNWDAAPENIAAPQNLRQFAELAIAPLLTDFGLFLATDAKIRNGYRRIYFASRDGWLPHAIYAQIRERLGGLPTTYFAAGRRAYYPFLYDSFFDYLEKLPKAGDPDAYTLLDLVKTYFTDSPVLPVLEEKLSEEEKELLFFRDRERCVEILRRFSPEIAACMRRKRERAKAYYESVFDASEERYLVFDLGYSGSIGKALSTITGRPTDKIYFWETDKNRELDKVFGTSTRVFLKSDTHVYLNLMLEELCSPCEGGVIGFAEDRQPVTEKMCISETHRADLAAVHAACLDYAGDFCALLGEYAPCAVLEQPGPAMAICQALLRDLPFCNLHLFKNIVFPDPVHISRTASLEKKMERHLLNRTTMHGTGFENPANAFNGVPRPYGKRKIGIHLHLYNVSQSHEMVRYLQDFPVPFDLYISIVDLSFEHTVQNLFSRNFIPKLQRLQILKVPNRGRDIAPWILSTRQYQASYELFCHIHSKASTYSVYGEEWRKYLLDNVIGADAVADILNIFEDYPDMGCVFPAMFSKLYWTIVNLNVPVYGSEQEYGLMCDMLRRMGLGEEVCRSEFFFSGGTMMWYRPEALRQLFTFELDLEEFAQEPIGVGGTLAHAMERLPALIASRNGYTVKSLTRIPA